MSLQLAMTDGQFARITLSFTNSDGDALPGNVNWINNDVVRMEIDPDGTTMSCRLHALRPTGDNPPVRIDWDDGQGYSDYCEVTIATDPVVANRTATVSPPSNVSV